MKTQIYSVKESMSANKDSETSKLNCVSHPMLTPFRQSQCPHSLSNVVMLSWTNVWLKTTSSVPSLYTSSLQSWWGLYKKSTSDRWKSAPLSRTCRTHQLMPCSWRIKSQLDSERRPLHTLELFAAPNTSLLTTKMKFFMCTGVRMRTWRV